MISCFVLFVFLVTSGFPTKPASCLDQRISTANKFNPNLAYDYLQNLADRHPEQITSVVIWLAENVLSSKAMNSLKKSFAENLTRSYNVTVWYIGEAFSFIHLYAKAMEVEKIASYELVSEVNIHGDFVLAHKCLDVSVPTIRADRKVNIGYNGSGIRIAILDSGINKTHPDLDDLDDDPTTNDPKVILERDFTGENITIDPDGHGTECAGVAAGTGNASRGIYRGVAPGAWLLNGRIYRSDGFCDANWWTDAIDWATANGADVISLSSGITYFSGGAQIRTDGTYPPSPAADRAVDHGVVFVAGAGNKGIPHNPWNYIEAPGDAFDVITAGVSDDMNTQSMQDDVIWDSSPKGPTGDGRSKPDILAPGVKIIAPSAGYASGDYYSSDTGSSLYSSRCWCCCFAFAVSSGLDPWHGKASHQVYSCSK
jgi:subtilisin family serine protease